MRPIAGVRWLLALMPWRRGLDRRRRGSEPADMGTAFGLDAITTLEPQALETPEPAEPLSRFELRLHRRSTF